MKHPAVRFPSYDDFPSWAKARIREIVADVKRRLAPLFVLDDLAVTGSFGRDAADLHSDLDLNFEVGTEARRRAAIAAAKANREAFEAALEPLRQLYREFGLRFQLSFQEPSIRDVPEKACYRILENKAYHPESKQRVDRQPDGTYRPRLTPVPLRPRRFNFGDFDESGDWVDGLDPWNNDSPCSIRPDFGRAQFAELRRTFGPKFIEIGSTPKTAHYAVHR